MPVAGNSEICQSSFWLKEVSSSHGSEASLACVQEHFISNHLNPVRTVTCYFLIEHFNNIISVYVYIAHVPFL
jgi:hypothetical protein